MPESCTSKGNPVTITKSLSGLLDCIFGTVSYYGWKEKGIILRLTHSYQNSNLNRVAAILNHKLQRVMGSGLAASFKISISWAYLSKRFSDIKWHQNSLSAVTQVNFVDDLSKLTVTLTLSMFVCLFVCSNEMKGLFGKGFILREN